MRASSFQSLSVPARRADGARAADRRRRPRAGLAPIPHPGRDQPRGHARAPLHQLLHLRRLPVPHRRQERRHADRAREGGSEQPGGRRAHAGRAAGRARRTDRGRRGDRSGQRAAADAAGARHRAVGRRDRIGGADAAVRSGRARRLGHARALPDAPLQRDDRVRVPVPHQPRRRESQADLRHRSVRVGARRRRDVAGNHPGHGDAAAGGGARARPARFSLGGGAGREQHPDVAVHRGGRAPEGKRRVSVGAQGRVRPARRGRPPRVHRGGRPPPRRAGAGGAPDPAARGRTGRQAAPDRQLLARGRNSEVRAHARRGRAVAGVPRVGVAEPVRGRRQLHADVGRREPEPHDHGERVSRGCACASASSGRSRPPDPSP